MVNRLRVPQVSVIAGKQIEQHTYDFVISLRFGNVCIEHPYAATVRITKMKRKEYKLLRSM